MGEVYEMARRVSTSRCPVFIVGERGTGRETVARTIHRHGPLRDAPFVRSLGKDLELETLRRELSKDEGMVYIEDVGAMPSRLQQWLEEWFAAHARRRDNGSPKGVRVIVSSRPRIDVYVSDGRFRRSLYDALSVVRIDLPPLRERPQDIPLLALHFLKEACLKNDLASKTLSRSALVLLAALPWRDNAAELKGLIERLAVLIPRGVILQEDVLQHLRFENVRARGAGGGTLREARHQFEREFIAATLQRHQWRMEPAAAELGLERTNLYRKMKQLSIVRGESPN
jgi:DNA-binding NtrC family response regulator